jgi:hypothetical protein
VVLDVARLVAQRLELGQPLRPPPARLSMKPVRDEAQRRCRRVVGQRRAAF